MKPIAIGFKKRNFIIFEYFHRCFYGKFWKPFWWNFWVTAYIVRNVNDVKQFSLLYVNIGQRKASSSSQSFTRDFDFFKLKDLFLALVSQEKI